MKDLQVHRHTSPSLIRSPSPRRSLSPLRLLTPSGSFRAPSLSHHHSCLNYLRDPSMKRYMEIICASTDDEQRASSHAMFTRSLSAPVTSSPFSSHFVRASSPDMSARPSLELPRAFNAEHFAEGDADLPVNSLSSSSSFDYGRSKDSEILNTAKNSRVSFANSVMGLSYSRHLNRKDSDNEEPAMLAVVDMGTNSFHIVVAEANCQGEFRVLDSEKEYVQLGSGSMLSVITPDAEARALEAMKRFQMLASAYKAPLKVVATSAVREAGNRGAFLSNMLEKVGVEIEVLSGREEACLIYQGVLQALPVYDKLVLTVDIGGGSTEIVIGMAGSPIYAVSVKLGHLRLTDLFIGIGNEPITKCQLDDVRTHVRGVLRETGVAEHVRNAGFEMAIGSSGTIETIEQIVNQGYAGECATLLISEQAHMGLSGLRDREFKREELAVVVRKLCKAKNNDQRSKVFGLSPKRAEFLVAGAILLEEIFIALDIHKMRVSPYALREGVIVDTLSKTCKHYKFSPNVRWSSVARLARRFYENERLVSASHSAHLAADILAGLRMNSAIAEPDHVSEIISLLDETDMELLEASVTLHAIGMSIGFRDYHKHSHYLIKCIAEQ